MDTTTPEFGLIIIGDEILSGKRADKHLPKVIELLQARGLSLAWARCIGDDRPRITAALRDAFDGTDVVFCCGGIGATPDDHTRQCAAAALGVELALHPQARELIEQLLSAAVQAPPATIRLVAAIPLEPEKRNHRQRARRPIHSEALVPTIRLAVAIHLEPP